MNAVLSGDAERAEQLAIDRVARAAVTLTTALDAPDSDETGRAKHPTENLGRYRNVVDNLDVTALLDAHG